MTRSDCTPTVAVLVAESRARCGLPPKVEDPNALRTVAGLFLAVRADGAATPASRRRRAA